MTNQNSNPASGYVSIILCCLTTAISMVFISHLNKTHNEMVSIAITFSYAAILFNLFNIKKIGSLYSSAIKNFKLIFKMNVVTLLNWSSTFVVLNYLDPATAICIILCVQTVTLFFILTPLDKIKENKHLVYSILFIIGSMLLIINQHVSTASQIGAKTITLGLIWCVIGGITGAFIGMSSVGMGKAGFSVSQILATRFYLLILTGVIGFFIAPHAMPVVIDWKYYILASLVIVIFPLMMYQTAVKALGALIVSLIEPFTPVFTYLLQILVGDYHFNFITVALLVMSSIAIIWFVRIEQNISQAKKMIENKIADVEFAGAN